MLSNGCFADHVLFRNLVTHRAAESGFKECAELLASYDPLSVRLADERASLPEDLAEKAVHDDISQLLAAFHDVPISVLEIVHPDAAATTAVDAAALEETLMEAEA